MLRVVLQGTAIGVVLLLLAIQTVPYGRHHANPPVRMEPVWDGRETRELARRACFDCHSNETIWPWYANLAPVSWLLQRDVDAGRTTLNFSEWSGRQREARESAKTVRQGEMPPWFYKVLRPYARLTPEDRQALIRGLDATFGRRER